MEKWKLIEVTKDYLTQYEVSSYGNVRSVDRVSKNPKTPDKIIFGKKLSLQVCKKGYVHVALMNKTYSVHRLVANAFIPNPLNKEVVNHIDFNTQNNNVDNLEWCTIYENIRHSIDNNRYNYLITDEDVLFIRKNFKLLGSKKMAKMFNISPSYVYNIAVHKEKVNVQTDIFQLNSDIPCKKIVTIDNCGNVINEYKSISEAARLNNTRLSAIQRVLVGERISLKGIVFRHKTDDNKYFIKTPSPKNIKKGKRRNVLQIGLNGEVLNTFKSAKQAADFIGVSAPSISFAILGRQKTSGGYQWKYA